MQIHAIPGRLPAFWPRRVVFVANLLSLFFGNEQETQALRSEVGALETYGNRLIPVLNLLFTDSPNILVLQRGPDPDLVAYFCDVLGLAMPDLHILGHDDYLALAAGSDGAGASDAAALSAHPAEWIDGFVTDQALCAFARRVGKQTISTAEGSYRGNNKRLLHDHLGSVGLPIFDTCIAREPGDVPRGLSQLASIGYREAVLKAPIGASGIGMIRLAVSSRDRIPDYLFHEGPCLVQGWLDEAVPGVRPLGSPSVQFFADDRGVTLFDVTEQILSRQSVHEGNVAPPPSLEALPDASDVLLEHAAIACRWLHEQAYRGTGSIDFHVVERDGVVEARICEINARVTGATYPAVLARRFAPDGAWLMRNLVFREPIGGVHLLEQLRRRKLLFLPESRTGILPINFNLDLSGRTTKGQFLCLAPTTKGAAGLLNAARDALPMKSEYDRD